MVRVDSDSDVSFDPRPPMGAAGGPHIVPPANSEGRGAIWLDGDVLTYACPDCGAPMSVRLWLLLADCWRCHASIELTPEQQRMAEQLLERRAAKASTVPPPVVAPAPPPPKPKPPVPPPKPKVPVAKLVHAVPPTLPNGETPSVGSSLKAGLQQPPQLPPPLPKVASRPQPVLAASATKPPNRWRRWLAIAAMLFAGIGLGIWLLSRGSRPPGQLGDLPKVIAALRTPEKPRMFEGRDPRIRKEILAEEGGSVLTEAAVAAGLRWVSQHQADDGHWSLDHFSQAGNCHGQCDGEGEESDVAATALSLLPLLGAGQSAGQGTYQDTVARGIRWLVRQERPDGDLRGSGIGRMYAHALATIVLCEALAVDHDEALREPAQRAIDFIVRGQHPAGGWRYEPGQEGDTSVVGWQLMALQCARMAYLKVPDVAFERAGHFLDTMKQGRHGGLYVYQPGHRATPAMIAEGLLCRQYLGWPKDHPGLQEGIKRLLGRNLPTKDQPNIYYWYYGTQVLHHVGGEDWQTWNKAVREALLALQEKEGHRAGSWAPRGGAIGDHDTRTGGRIYMTSLALCTLEVYYRYLPLYRAIEVDP